MKIYSVSEVNSYTKGILDEDAVLSDIYVSGEISNLKRHSSGHMYFTLKDSSGQINAAMFKWQCQYLRFSPANGMNVVARGKVTLYEAGGQYQMVVASLQPDGVGALYAAYEKLKAQLEEEGLFDSSRKRPIPKMPSRIGIVTSKTGAAVQDMLNIISRRWQMCEIILAPVMVQGEPAPAQIAHAVKELNRLKCCDVMIVGRGGGSIEDLWAFNSETVVRAVAESEIPVISAVGHETDFTLCDFAADLRAPTPSAAAELAVPEIGSIKEYVDDTGRFISSAMSAMINDLTRRVSAAAQKRCFSAPGYLYESKAQQLDALTGRLNAGMAATVSGYRERLSGVCAALAALNPLAVLGRGYAMVTRKNEVVSSAADLAPGDVLKIIFADGSVSAGVTDEQDDNA